MIRNIINISLVITLAAALALSCRELSVEAVEQIAFAVEDLAFTSTRADAVTESDLNTNGFYVGCTTGSAGSESSVWISTAFTLSGGAFKGGRYWPETDPGYHFFASNRPLTFNAAGTTVSATDSYDVVCAYLPSPSYKASNLLTFKHIFARLGDVTFTAVDGYTISGISATITPKTGGTYNLRTEVWSSTTTGSATTVANTTPGTKSNDIYLVPDEYTLSVTWTASKGSYSQTYTGIKTKITLTAGYKTSVSATFNGDGSEIEFLTEVAAWGSNPLAPGNLPIDGSDDYVEPEPEPVNALMFANTGSTNSVTVTLSNNGGNTPSVEYSIDGESWSSWDYSAITLTPGESVYIRGNNPDGFSSSSSKYSTFAFSGSSTVSCTGNVMTLLNYTAPPTTIPSAYCYYKMFQGCTSLTTAPELPATTLVYNCYDQMFYGCTSLTTAPELPATTLRDFCYQCMFYNCTSLTTAPELPATTLAYGCYNYMFYRCMALTTVPELPATTLAISCYNSMFRGCIALQTAPVLPATTLVSNCYSNMFYDCSSLNYVKAMFTTTPGGTYTNNWLKNVAASGTFVKNSAATWSASGSSGIPSSWTVQTVSE